MGALAGPKNFTAERGSTFDFPFTYSPLIKQSEDFSADGETAKFTLAHNPVQISSNPDKWLLVVHLNGFLLDDSNYAVQDNHLYFSNVPTVSDIRVTYRYKGTADLSAFQARMQIRTEPEGEVLCELTTENSRILLDDQGVVRLLVSETVTAEWMADTYVYDLELANGGYVVRLLEGKFRIRPNVTEPTS